MKKNVFKVLICLVLALVIGFNAKEIFAATAEKEAAEQELNELQNLAVGMQEENVKLQEMLDNAQRDMNVYVQGEDIEFWHPELDINFEELKSINPDFVGWLYIPSIQLAHPIVHENEEGEYLKKTFQGNNNASGAIFMDKASRLAGWSSFIFGHNMRGGAMFGALHALEQDRFQDALMNDPFVYIYTEDWVYCYQIFNCMYTNTEKDVYKAVLTNEDYDEVLSIMKESSQIRWFEFDESIRPNLISLSTCAGQGGKKNRFVVNCFQWY